MATFTVRNVDFHLKERLRVRAAQHGRSMAAELRQILSDVLIRDPGGEPNLAEAIRRRFAPLGGVELPSASAGARRRAAWLRMIVFDTNVLLELMRPSPDPTVFAWLAEPAPRDALHRQRQSGDV